MEVLNQSVIFAVQNKLFDTICLLAVRFLLLQLDLNGLIGLLFWGSDDTIFIVGENVSVKSLTVHATLGWSQSVTRLPRFITVR